MREAISGHQRQPPMEVMREAISGHQRHVSPQIEVARQLSLPMEVARVDLWGNGAMVSTCMLSPPMEVARVYLWGLWGNGAVVSTCMLFEPMEVD
jgi:hypothetical protein